MNQPLHVTVTGAAGQIGYSLLFRIASGDMLGPDQPVVLRLLEIEPAMKALEGVVMELDDCAFPLLADVVTTSDTEEAFDGHVVGAPGRLGAPQGGHGARRPALHQRRHLRPPGQGDRRRAAADVRILVVGNPCNTNCLIARSNAPDVPADRWFAMTRLDENRAKSQLAHKAGVPVAEVTNMAIWGNHSATQFPDFAHARIGGKPAPEVISDGDWLRGEFIEHGPEARRGGHRGSRPLLGGVGGERGHRLGSQRSFRHPARRLDFAGRRQPGRVRRPEGLQFGFPVSTDGRNWSVVEGLEHDDFAREKIRLTTEELLQERDLVKDLLPS